MIKKQRSNFGSVEILKYNYVVDFDQVLTCPLFGGIPKQIREFRLWSRKSYKRICCVSD
jgi:hypothetical protein